MWHDVLSSLWSCKAVVIVIQKKHAVPTQQGLSNKAHQWGSERVPTHGYHDVPHGKLLVTVLEFAPEKRQCVDKENANRYSTGERQQQNDPHTR